MKSTLGEAVIYWDLADPQSPYGYNPITPVSPALRPLVASGLIDALRKQWADSWGPRMEHLLRNAILLLLEQLQADLRDVLPLFWDKTHRAALLQNVGDEQIRQFWEVEWKALRYERTLDAVSPIANK